MTTALPRPRAAGLARAARLPRPLLLGGVLLVAILLALLAAELLMGTPRPAVEQLGVFLAASSLGSLLLGAGAVRWAGRRLGSLRARLAAAFGVGLLVAAANVSTTAALMFLSPHDLGLLFLLLAFAAVVSMTFGYAATTALTRDLETLAGAAAQVARGDLSVRVGGRGADEVARLSAAFDHMAERLRAASERERALEADRRGLVAAVSHDLRTPLATTRAMIEAINDGVVSEPAEVRRYLRLVAGEVQHLTRLIDDLFELSQIESGALRLTVARLDVGQLVSETVHAYEAQAREGGVLLEERVEPSLPAVQGDGPRLQRVLRNLVDNALRHTPTGGVVRVAASQDTGGVALEVADSGPGIPADERERVFERFYRAESSRHRGEGPEPRGAGSGLGLAIARGLVHAHGGTITAVPSPLGGACVRVHLPTAPA